MPKRWALVIACSVLPTFGLALPAQRQTPADALLSLAREAIGGRERLNRVKSLELKGTVVANDQGVPPDYRRMPVEIRAILPDRFSTFSALRESWTASGVEGNFLLFRTKPLDSMRGIPVSPLPDGFVDDKRKEFSTFVLFYLLRTDTAWPLTLQSGVTSTAGFDTLEFRGRAGLVLRLDLEKANHVPVRIRQTVPTAAGENTEAMQVVEDRRDVSGIRLPFRIRNYRNGKPFMNSQEVDVIRTNVNFAADTFSSLRYRP